MELDRLQWKERNFRFVATINDLSKESPVTRSILSFERVIRNHMVAGLIESLNFIKSHMTDFK